MELMEWCSDVRAYQPVFESYLMDCLEVSMKNSLLADLYVITANKRNFHR